jgi:nucleoside-diphosphate-sugar epimerase
LKGKSVLVTGGAGFIGSHLVRALVAEGAKVRVLDNFSTGSRINLYDVDRRVEMQEGDIRNAIACRNACRGIDTLFHLAAYISVPGSVRDPVTADAINMGGTLNLLLAARDSNVKRFVYSSSSAVYGDTQVLPTHEEVLPKPTSPYGIEKLYGEHMCRLFHQLYGLEAVALRYFNVYGPGQNPESEYAAVIPKFISMLLSGNAPTIFGDGTQTRDFLFVEDVVQANLCAAKTEQVGGEVFNVAGGKSVSLCELAFALNAVLKVKKKTKFGPERAGDIKHSSADITRARQKLGFEPQFDLQAGLEHAVKYYKMRNG